MTPTRCCCTFAKRRIPISKVQLSQHIRQGEPGWPSSGVKTWESPQHRFPRELLWYQTGVFRLHFGSLVCWWIASSRALSDNTFADIHQFAWFDWAILIPYFILLTILSFYGLHRYEMIRGYLKHKKRAQNTPLPHFDELPRVTIQLPLYNEKYVVERLIEETLKMDYPRELLQIQVLDDSTDETASVYRGAGGALSGAGPSDRVSSSRQSAWLSRRARCRKAWRPQPASSSRSSTPISCRPPIS